MDDFRSGLVEAIVGLVGGIVQGAILDGFAKSGLMPWYGSLGFLVAGIVANVLTIAAFQVAGIVYTLGWLVGGLILWQVLSPLDLVVNVGGPLVMLGLRAWLWAKDEFGG